MTIGDEKDGPITGHITLSDILFVVKRDAVYTMTLADQIDPERTNADLPHSAQKTLAEGSGSDTVSRTLLTADELFKTPYVARENREVLMRTALDISRSLVGAAAICREVQADVTRLAEGVNSRAMATNVPSVENLEASVNAFIQRCHSTIQLSYDLPRPFVKLPPMGWPDNFALALGEMVGDEHPFTVFAGQMTPFVKFIRNARHCIEHRRGDQRLDIVDFRLTKQGLIERPSIAVIHSATGHDSTDLTAWMAATIDKLIATVEAMIFHVAEMIRARDTAGLPVAIFEIPDAQRDANRRVRLAYFTRFKDQWVRLG